MLLKGTLNAHLEEVDCRANEIVEQLTIQMANVEDVTEQLKSEKQLEWIRRMNSIRNRAEEIVLHELIYS